MAKPNIPPLVLWKDTGLAPVGPNELQKRYYINLMPPDKRPHVHTKDLLLSIGAYGSGKTVGEVNCAIDMGMMHPGLQCYIGAYDITMARRNTIEYFESAFKNPDTGKLWKHPACSQGFGPKTNILSLYNGSKYTYLNLKDAIAKNVGFSSGILCIEEPHTLPDENSFLTLISRARAKPPEVNQIILCTNPTRSVDSWINNMFHLNVFDGVDTSQGPVEKLVGEGCTCQVCVNCSSHGKEVGWKKKRDGNYECPDCGAIKDFWTWEGEKIFCPGGEQWMRVVKSETGHNKHLSQSYMQSMMSVYDKQTVAVMVHGRTDLNLEDDQIYHKFNKDIHVLKEDEAIDWDEDIVWGIDFNLKPQCSSVSQLIDGELIVKDEIIMSGPTMDNPYGKASAEDVAREFCRRYKHHYKGTIIRMFGDPKGWDGQTSRELTKYDKMLAILHENGFLTSMEADREQIPLKECVDTLNEVLVKGKLFINPKCLHVIASLANLKWKKSATSTTEATDAPSMDKSGDHNAARSNNRSRVYTMTHPTDGLRYAVWKLLPMLQGTGQRSATFGDKVVEEHADGTTTVTYTNAPESTKRIDEAAPGSLDAEYERMFGDVGRVIEQIENQPFRAVLGNLGFRLPPATPKKEISS